MENRLREKYHPDEVGEVKLSPEVQTSLKRSESEPSTTRERNILDDTEQVLENVGRHPDRADRETPEPDGQAKSEVGYDYELTNGKLPEGIEECSICHLIPRVPAKVSCCGHIFCRFCIKPYSSCPLCKQEFTSMIDKLHERKIQELEVRCVHHSKGCQWTGELRRMEDHVTRNPDHESKRCLYQVTSCKKCDEKLMYIEVNGHLKNKCVYRTVDCDFKFAGCEFRCPEMNMPKHIQNFTSKHLTLVTRIVKQDIAQQNIPRDSMEAEIESEEIHSTQRLKIILAVILSAVLIFYMMLTLITLQEEIVSIKKDIRFVMKEQEEISDQLKTELKELKTELKTELKELETRLIKYMSEGGLLGYIQSILKSMLLKVVPIGIIDFDKLL